MWPRKYRLIVLVQDYKKPLNPLQAILEIINAEPKCVKLIQEPSKPKRAAKRNTHPGIKYDNCIVEVQNPNCNLSLINRMRQQFIFRSHLIQA